MTLTACASCGKLHYPSRKAARKAARRKHPGERLSAYQACGGYGWHIGHLPGAVVHGVFDRDQFRTMRGQA